MSDERSLRRVLRAGFVALLLAAGKQAAAAEFNPSPHAIEVPAWFQETFLDFREDVREAAKRGKRMMVYFGQDGCPYCRELMRVNFSQKDIADAARAKFVAVALNVWGDRETTWVDGRNAPEKALAARLGVQFTPTLIFLDEKGAIALRLNGYYPPHKFRVALDYASAGKEGRPPFADYLKQHVREPASGKLHEQAFFLKPPLDLDRSRKPGARPLAVLFEQKDCAACDELHGKGFRDPAARALLGKFDVARLELFGAERIVTTRGKATTAAEWARELKVAYTPTFVFFDERGAEVFRVEAYLKPFHLASSLDYVASGAYRKQPSFQRFIQARAERIRAAGGRVDLW
jgi:thioredoxin-related protein